MKAILIAIACIFIFYQPVIAGDDSWDWVWSDGGWDTLPEEGDGGWAVRDEAPDDDWEYSRGLLDDAYVNPDTGEVEIFIPLFPDDD